MSDGTFLFIMGIGLVIFGAWFLIFFLAITAIKAFYENVWKDRR